MEPFQTNKHYNLYSSLSLLAGIYYTLPVFQLVYYYQETAERSGNLDTCYYNYLCQYPYGAFNDFGHVFSNFGYIILGLLFKLIVWLRWSDYKSKQTLYCIEILNNCRSRSHRNLVENEDLKRDLKDLKITHPLHKGIPESYGIFYAMGAALTLEGLVFLPNYLC